MVENKMVAKETHEFRHHFDDAAPEFHARAVQVFSLFAEHETAQANRILNAIRSLPGARIIGREHAEAGSRAATIAFTMEGKPSGDIVRQLVKRELAVRNGHFYARRCLEALGIQDPDDGVVRISMVHYNTVDEVDRLVAALKELR